MALGGAWPWDHSMDHLEFFTNERLQDVCFNWKVNSSFFSHPYKAVRVSVCAVPVPACVGVRTHICVCVCARARDFEFLQRSYNTERCITSCRPLSVPRR